MAEAENGNSRIRRVDIDDLKRDFQFYPRGGVDYAVVTRFVDAMRAGCKFPPLKICSATGRIIDGFHRYAAYQQLGIRQVDAIGYDVAGDAEFFYLCVEANKAHGLGYSQADQEKIVKLAARLGLEREKIAFAVALPIQKVNEMVRNIPNYKPGENNAPKKLFAGHVQYEHANHRSSKPLRSEPKTDAITSSGFLFYCTQVIRFMRSDLCDLRDETIMSKIRELESAVINQLNPNKLKDLVCERVKDGAATFADLSIELGIPESQVKAIVEELKAVGRINTTKEGRRTEGQRGSTKTVLSVADDETPSPAPRDGRAVHPAIQAFKAATGRYPNKLLYDKVIEALGDFPDLTRLNDVFVAWVGRGYNPQNLSWLEWYINGVPENGNGKNKSQRNHESASQRNVRNLQDSLTYLSGVQGNGREVDPEVEARLLASGS